MTSALVEWTVARGEKGTTPPCSVRGCTGLGRQRGWCSKHYLRWKRTGNPLGARPCVDCGATISAVDRRVMCPTCASERRRVRNRIWMREVYHPTAGRTIRQAWRDANRDKVREANRRSQKNNPASMRRGSDAWKKRNPEKVAARNRRSAHRRRARLVAAVAVPYSAEAVYERDQWTCQLCLTAIDPTLVWRDPMMKTIDHVVPLARGGTDTEDNVQAAHLVCNVRKGPRLVGRIG